VVDLDVCCKLHEGVHNLGVVKFIEDKLGILEALGAHGRYY